MNAMQNQNQASLLKLTATLLVSVLVTVLLYSCSKDEVSSAGRKEGNIASQASDRTSTIGVPFDIAVYVECGNGGNGELVHLTGSTNFTYNISWTEHGFTYGYHSNTYQISGVGLESGEVFSGSGNTSGQVFGSWANDHWVSNFTDQLKIRGTNTSFTLKRTFHLTVSPDDQVTVEFDHYEEVCD
jgi:hypothetical protein